ncbi:hypothetical protein D3C73_1552930 [compost metagenome]
MFLGHVQIGRATLAEPAPWVAGTGRDGVEAGVHFTVDLRDHRRQQALFVAEMVIQGTARQTDLGGEVVH